MYLNLLILLLSSFSYAIEDNAATEISFNTTAATMATTTISLSTISESVTTLPGNETAINRIVLSGNDTAETSNSTTEPPKIGCTCGIFLSGQFKKGSKEPPKGNPALLNEHFEVYPCNNHGNKLCSNKCLDVVSKYIYIFLIILKNNIKNIGFIISDCQALAK